MPSIPILTVTLTPKVEQCRAVLDRLWWLKGRDDTEEVWQLMKDLMAKVDRYREESKEQTCRNAQDGLHRLGNSAEVRHFLSEVQNVSFDRRVDRTFDKFVRRSEAACRRAN